MGYVNTFQLYLRGPDVLIFTERLLELGARPQNETKCSSKFDRGGKNILFVEL